jgi:hypothetical protein
VLQRKAGYREVLRWWLSWEGGEELFHAGQRDVASLYEYWLFLELLGWFCQKCRGGNRPAVEELIDGLEEGSPNLRPRKRMELGPFVGTFAGQSRRLNARFAYNRRFEVTQDRHAGGSWTRQLHPDYTLTFWPEDLIEAGAEHQELPVQSVLKNSRFSCLGELMVGDAEGKQCALYASSPRGRTFIAPSQQREHLPQKRRQPVHHHALRLRRKL